ncbi:MAG TPA: ATP-binding protein [Kiritimatiellia bacterium]|nr:ATP-binding protein [Kiritimatiellia bacterium]
MSPYADPLILITRDDDLAGRVGRYLRGGHEVVRVEDLEGFLRASRGRSPGVVMVDVLTDAGTEHLSRLVHDHPEHVVMVLGMPRTDPVLKAAHLPVYAVVDYPVDAIAFSALVKQGFDLVSARAEIRMLKDEARLAKETALRSEGGASRVGKGEGLSIRDLSRVFRSIENVDRLLERMVEELATVLKVSRIGIFLKEAEGQDIAYRSGWMMREDAAGIRFAESDGFVHWMAEHGHMICRDQLDGLREASVRQLAGRVLDRIGVEMLVPLRNRRGLLGWIALGPRVNGSRYDAEAIDALIEISDVMAASLESALLYREVTLQKKLAETLLDAVPTGIVFVDAEGMIRWFSPAAAEILDAPAARAVNKAVDVLGSALADLARRSIRGEPVDHPLQWTDPMTHKPLHVMLSAVREEGRSLGVVIMLQDMTQQMALKARQERVERAAFWTELAASMSHEVRNPLVAIKTFAQLLPERYHDEEFRHEFSQLVNMEVNRLNSIIDQINHFANPPEIEWSDVDLREPLRRSVQQLEKKLNGSDSIEILPKVPDVPLKVTGDARALEDCFLHVLNNSVEALEGMANGKITLELEARANGKPDSGVLVRISDNGRGMDPEIRGKVFSPFCTTKARGMGLGLSIAQRTVMDHNGQLDVKSGRQGTTVNMLFPVQAKEAKT